MSAVTEPLLSKLGWRVLTEKMWSRALRAKYCNG